MCVCVCVCVCYMAIIQLSHWTLGGYQHRLQPLYSGSWPNPFPLYLVTPEGRSNSQSWSFLSAHSAAESQECLSMCQDMTPPKLSGSPHPRMYYNQNIWKTLLNIECYVHILLYNTIDAISIFLLLRFPPLNHTFQRSAAPWIDWNQYSPDFKKFFHFIFFSTCM